MKKILVTALLWALAAPAWAQRRHTVVTGDTLWDLATHYYSDAWKWTKIASANPAPNIHDPHWIYPGQVLIIPDVEPDPHFPPPAPVQASAPIKAPPPEPEPEPPPPAPPPPAPKPAPKPYRSDEAQGLEPASQGLSTSFPDGLVGQPPSMYRFKVLPSWKVDGTVTEFEGREAAAATGDNVTIRLRGSAGRRARFVVYRKAAPTDTDKDQRATYVSKVGVVEVRRQSDDTTYRAAVVESNDTIQVGDMLKRE